MRRTKPSGRPLFVILVASAFIGGSLTVGSISGCEALDEFLQELLNPTPEPSPTASPEPSPSASPSPSPSASPSPTPTPTPSPSPSPTPSPSPSPTPTPSPTPGGGDEAAGQAFYDANGCGTCHCADASGDCLLSAPSLVGSSSTSVLEKNDGTESHAGGQVNITSQDADDVAAWLATL